MPDYTYDTPATVSATGADWTAIRINRDRSTGRVTSAGLELVEVRDDGSERSLGVVLASDLASSDAATTRGDELAALLFQLLEGRGQIPSGSLT